MSTALMTSAVFHGDKFHLLAGYVSMLIHFAILSIGLNGIGWPLIIIFLDGSSACCLSNGIV
jgi:hypothetical protein